MTEERKKNILEQHAAERQTCQNWTRVMGYYRPTESFNSGKQSEANERVYFETATPCCCCGN